VSFLYPPKTYSAWVIVKAPKSERAGHITRKIRAIIAVDVVAFRDDQRPRLIGMAVTRRIILKIFTKNFPYSDRFRNIKRPINPGRPNSQIKFFASRLAK
jgi:hypothetical protein